MRSIVRTAMITLGLFVAACGGGSSEPATPAGEASGAPAAPPAPETADTGAPAAAGSAAPEAAAPAAPAPAALKDTLGTVASIDVTDPAAKKPKTYGAPKDVDAILKAIGTDQTPSAQKHNCGDITLSMKDDSGAEKGSVSLCGKLGPKDKIENADFSGGGGGGGLTLADADGLKKALKKAPSAAPKKPAAGDKGAGAGAGAPPGKKKQGK